MTFSISFYDCDSHGQKRYSMNCKEAKEFSQKKAEKSSPYNNVLRDTYVKEITIEGKPLDERNVTLLTYQSFPKFLECIENGHSSKKCLQDLPLQSIRKNFIDNPEANWKK